MILSPVFGEKLMKQIKIHLDDYSSSKDIIEDVKKQLIESLDLSKTLKSSQSPSISKRLIKENFFLENDTNLPLKSIVSNDYDYKSLYYSLIQAYEHKQIENIKKIQKLLEEQNMLYNVAIVTESKFETSFSDFLAGTY